MKNQTGDTVYNIENRNWKMMLTTLHLICVESLYRYRAQTNEGDGQTTTPSRCICYPPTGGLDTTLQVTSKVGKEIKKGPHWKKNKQLRNVFEKLDDPLGGLEASPWHWISFTKAQK